MRLTQTVVIKNLQKPMNHRGKLKKGNKNLRYWSCRQKVWHCKDLSSNEKKS